MSVLKVLCKLEVEYVGGAQLGLADISILGLAVLRPPMVMLKPLVLWVHVLLAKQVRHAGAGAGGGGGGGFRVSLNLSISCWIIRLNSAFLCSKAAMLFSVSVGSGGFILLCKFGHNS